MVGLVILMVIIAIFMARINPFLTAIVISGIIGYACASVFVKYGHAPGWIVPASILFWICAASPGIAAFLTTIVPPRRKR